MRWLCSDNGTKFYATFRQMCDANGLRQIFTTLGTQEQNGVAERRLGHIADSTQASSLEAHLFFPEYQLRARRRLWAGAPFFANDNFRTTAGSANPGDLPLYILQQMTGADTPAVDEAEVL